MLTNEESGGTATSTFYRKSQDETSWTELSVPVTLTGYIYWPSIAIDSAGNINMVYWTKTNNDTVYRVYYIRSIDGGWTWSTPQKITNENTKSSTDSIAIDEEGNLYIVYQSDLQPYAGYFLKSTK
jgi:sugar lactone lactonase YvrE